MYIRTFPRIPHLHSHIRTLTISLSSLICSMVRKSCSFTAESSLQPKNKRDRVNTSRNNENITLRQIIRNTRSQKYKHTYVYLHTVLVGMCVCNHIVAYINLLCVQNKNPCLHVYINLHAHTYVYVQVPCQVSHISPEFSELRSQSPT